MDEAGARRAYTGTKHARFFEIIARSKKPRIASTIVFSENKPSIIFPQLLHREKFPRYFTLPRYIFQSKNHFGERRVVLRYTASDFQKFYTQRRPQFRPHRR